MTKEELLKKWDELTTAYLEKEAQLESFVQKWLNEESNMSNKSMELLIDNTNVLIDKMKKEADSTIKQYNQIVEEEQLRKEQLESSKMIIKNQFGFSPDEIIITGGVLSSNANESHLIGRSKTNEELEAEKQAALAEIRHRTSTKQISLSEASQLKNQVNTAYNYKQDINSGMHK